MGEFWDEKLVGTESLVFASALVGFPQAGKYQNKQTKMLGETLSQTGKATDKQKQTQTEKRYLYLLRKFVEIKSKFALKRIA